MHFHWFASFLYGLIYLFYQEEWRNLFYYDNKLIFLKKLTSGEAIAFEESAVDSNAARSVPVDKKASLSALLLSVVWCG